MFGAAMFPDGQHYFQGRTIQSVSRFLPALSGYCDIVTQARLSRIIDTCDSSISGSTDVTANKPIWNFIYFIISPTNYQLQCRKMYGRRNNYSSISFFTVLSLLNLRNPSSVDAQFDTENRAFTKDLFELVISKLRKKLQNFKNAVVRQR